MDLDLSVRKNAQRLIDAYNEKAWNCTDIDCQYDENARCGYCHFADMIRPAVSGGKKSIHKIF